MTTATSSSPATLDLSSVPSADEPSYFGIRAGTWLKTLSIAGLFVLLFWPNLRRLWEKTNPFTGEPNWGHAIVIPVIGLYYLYINREQLRATTIRPAWSGLGIAVGGILVFAFGIWPGQNDWTKDVGMVITLFGVVTLLCGWDVMKIAWFPIVFLFCALPWPGLVYSYIAGPLQQLAASVAVRVLHLSGVDAGQFGTKIFIVGSNYSVRTLNVAEACAGLRSLMTFVSVAAAWAFLFPRPMWQRLILVVSAIPIAIFCNVMRVSGQGLLDRYVSPQLSESFAHQFVGLIMLIPAFFLILLVGWILQNIFIEEVDDKSALKAKASAASASSQANIVRRVVPAAIAPAKGAAPPATAAAPATAALRPAVIPPRPAITPPRPAGIAGVNRPAANPSASPKSDNPPTHRPGPEQA